MTFLETLYGSNYLHFLKEDKPAGKARFTANVYLAAFFIIGLFTVLLAIGWLFPEFVRYVFKVLDLTGSKSMLKVWVAGVMVVVFFIISYTTGSVRNYKQYVQVFLSQPAELQEGAAKKVLKYFYILMALFVLSLIGALY